MTELVSAPLPDAVGAIVDRLQGRVAELVRSSASDSRGELASLPEAILRRELPMVTRENLAVILRCVRENRLPVPDELRPAGKIAAQRADETVPLPLIVRNWQRGFERLWNEVVAIARADETRELEYVGAALISLMGVYLTEIVQSYERERAVTEGEEGGANHLLARMLLEGQDPRTYADRVTIELTASYHVLALGVDPSPDELVTDPTSRAVAGRRKLRHILRMNDFHRTPRVLNTLGPAGGHLLLPIADDANPATLEEIRDLVARIRSSAGVSVHAGLVESVPIEEVPRSGRLATEILNLVATRIEPPGVCRLADVALEYQLSRPGEGRRYLDEILGPLEPFPELVELLDSYFRHDLDRTKTARALHVHPNTVNNRLRRVASIVGIDPSGFEGIMVLGAAMTLRRVGMSEKERRRPDVS